MFENVQITTLPNGARVATSAMPGVNSFALSIRVSMGSRCERPSEAGWSHFAEHMAFAGSVGYPSRKAIVRALERVGGCYNAATTKELMRFLAIVPAHGAETAVGVLGDMVSRPLYPKAEVEKERKVILEEIKMGDDDPDGRLARIVSAALWPRHPLGRPILGSTASLAAIDAEGLHAFRRARFTARGTMVVAAGRLEHDRVVDLARPYLEALPDAPVPSFRPASRCRPPEPIAVEHRDVKQAHLSITFRGIRVADERRYARNLLVDILGGGSGSRLFRRIRDRHGLAYSIGAHSAGYRDVGAFHIRAEVDAAHLEKALALCGRELRAMAEKGVGARELAEKKTQFANELLLSGEISQDQRDLLECSIANVGVVISTEEDARRFRAVTAEEIRALAADIFRPENAVLGLVLPHDCKADPEKLREALFNG